MDLMWIFVIIGIVLGTIISIVFGIYSKASANAYTKSIFGVSSYDLIFNSVIFILVAGMLVLATVSAVVKDIAYPISRPINFTIETLLMAFLPSLVFLLMPYLRGYEYTSETALEFIVLTVKFGVLHLLLQFSGFYSNLFPPI